MKFLFGEVVVYHYELMDLKIFDAFSIHYSFYFILIKFKHFPIFASQHLFILAIESS